MDKVTTEVFYLLPEGAWPFDFRRPIRLMAWVTLDHPTVGLFVSGKEDRYFEHHTPEQLKAFANWLLMIAGKSEKHE